MGYVDSGLAADKLVEVLVYLIFCYRVECRCRLVKYYYRAVTV